MIATFVGAGVISVVAPACTNVAEPDSRSISLLVSVGAPDAEGAGYVHNLSRSRFAIGEDITPRQEFGFQNKSVPTGFLPLRTQVGPSQSPTPIRLPDSSALSQNQRTFTTRRCSSTSSTPAFRMLKLQGLMLTQR